MQGLGFEPSMGKIGGWVWSTPTLLGSANGQQNESSPVVSSKPQESGGEAFEKSEKCN